MAASTVEEDGSFLYGSFLERESQYECIPNLVFHQSATSIDPIRKSQLNEISRKLKDHADNFRNGPKRRNNKEKAAIVAQELSRYIKPSLSIFKKIIEKHCKDDSEKPSNASYYVEMFFFLVDVAIEIRPEKFFIRLSWEFVRAVIFPLVERYGGWSKIFLTMGSWVEQHPVETTLIAGGAILGLGYLLGKAILSTTDDSASKQKSSHR